MESCFPIYIPFLLFVIIFKEKVYSGWLSIERGMMPMSIGISLSN